MATKPQVGYHQLRKLVTKKNNVDLVEQWIDKIFQDDELFRDKITIDQNLHCLAIMIQFHISYDEMLLVKDRYVAAGWPIPDIVIQENSILSRWKWTIIFYLPEDLLDRLNQDWYNVKIDPPHNLVPERIFIVRHVTHGVMRARGDEPDWTNGKFTHWRSDYADKLSLPTFIDVA